MDVVLLVLDIIVVVIIVCGYVLIISSLPAVYDGRTFFYCSGMVLCKTCLLFTFQTKWEKLNAIEKLQMYKNT